MVSPEEFKVQSGFPVTKSIKKVIDDIDIIMSLRVQHERHTLNLLPQELDKRAKKYAKKYCITKELMKNKDILLLHPGPVNRNIDISDDMLKDKRCKVLEQVTNGVAVRMAILKKLILKQ